MLVFFFFKQKTAYELRISDWSSDVCSSDLRSAITGLIGVMDDAIDQMIQTAKAIALFEVKEFPSQMQDMSALIVECARITAEAMPLLRSLNPIGRASWRERVCQYV